MLATFHDLIALTASYIPSYTSVYFRSRSAFYNTYLHRQPSPGPTLQTADFVFRFQLTGIQMATCCVAGMSSHVATNVPRQGTFDWPPRGSAEHLGPWTFEKGMATFDARMIMQGRQVESPVFCPKSSPPRRDTCSLFPSMARSGTAETSFSESISESTDLGD